MPQNDWCESLRAFRFKKRKCPLWVCSNSDKQMDMRQSSRLESQSKYTIRNPGIGSIFGGHDSGFKDIPVMVTPLWIAIGVSRAKETVDTRADDLLRRMSGYFAWQSAPWMTWNGGPRPHLQTHPYIHICICMCMCMCMWYIYIYVSCIVWMLSVVYPHEALQITHIIADHHFPHYNAHALPDERHSLLGDLSHDFFGNHFCG